MTPAAFGLYVSRFNTATLPSALPDAAVVTPSCGQREAEIGAADEIVAVRAPERHTERCDIDDTARMKSRVTVRPVEFIDKQNLPRSGRRSPRHSPNHS